MICDISDDFVVNEEIIVYPGEDSIYEFKESFNWANKSRYAKAMASFANSTGGYLIFGVTNREKRLVGLRTERFDQIDPAEITTYLNGLFSPEIKWEKAVCKISGKKIGILYVAEALDKPVVATKNDDDIKEADVFFRYTGENLRIRFPELKNILEKEKKKYAIDLLDKMNIILKKGIDTVKLIDIEQLKDLNKEEVYIIDPYSSGSEIPVKKARESDSGKGIAVKIIETVGSVREVTKKEFANISSEMLVHTFLKGSIPENYNPMGFVERLPYETSGYVPLYFYLKNAGITEQEAIRIFEKAKSTTQGRKTLIKRLKEGDKDFSVQVNFSIFYKIISKNTKIEDLPKSQIKSCLQEIRSLSIKELKKEWKTIIKLLEYIYDKFYHDSILRREMRLAFCYVDQMLYSKE